MYTNSFLLERTISGVDLLKMALKTTSSHSIHTKTHNSVYAVRNVLSNGPPLSVPHILYNKSKLTCKQSVWAAISNLHSTSLQVIRCAKGQRAKMTYGRSIISERAKQARHSQACSIENCDN